MCCWCSLLWHLWVAIAACHPAECRVTKGSAKMLWLWPLPHGDHLGDLVHHQQQANNPGQRLMVPLAPGLQPPSLASTPSAVGAGPFGLLHTQVPHRLLPFALHLAKCGTGTAAVATTLVLCYGPGGFAQKRLSTLFGDIQTTTCHTRWGPHEISSKGCGDCGMGVCWVARL